MSEKTILAFGELLWDLLPGGAALGGAPFNFVYRCNCLGDRGLMVSRVGRDNYGARAREQVRRLGMDDGLIQTDRDRPTGTVNVSFDGNGDPDYHIVPDVAYDAIALTDELISAAEDVDCVCFGTLIQRSEPSRHALASVLDAADNSLKLLDINLRKQCHTPKTITGSLERADVLKLNEDEAGYLAGLYDLDGQDLTQLAADLCDKFSLLHCVVTLGHRGALAVSASGESVYVPGYKVNVADTVGSGDAFTAGFVHKLLHGAELEECVRFGNALGALVATQIGGTEPISLADVTAFENSAPQRISEPKLGK